MKRCKQTVGVGDTSRQVVDVIRVRVDAESQEEHNLSWSESCIAKIEVKSSRGEVLHRTLDGGEKEGEVMENPQKLTYVTPGPKACGAEVTVHVSRKRLFEPRMEGE